MKNNAQGMTMSGTETANTVPKIHTIETACTLHWPMMDRERNRVTLAQWNNLRARLHAGTLLRKYEFAAREVFRRF